MIYRLKKTLNEDTLDKEIKRIKANDILIVKQGINTLKYQVIQVTTNQLLTKKLDEKSANNQSAATTVAFTINSYYEGKLNIQYSSNKGKRKVTFSDVKSIELYRNGSKIADIDEISEETIKRQNAEKQEAREKKLSQKKETNKETTQEFINIINSLEIGDNLIISTGEIDEDEEIKKENITDISLTLIDKNDKFIFNFTYNSANGIDSSKYNVLKNVDDIILDKRSFRAATSGNRLILSVVVDDKSDEFQIENLIDFKKEKSVLKKEKSTKVKSIDIEAIKNNPRLRDALLKNPSLLGKLIGNKERGVIPFELRNKGGAKKEKSDGGNNSNKLKKGNKVEFSYFGNTIKGEIILMQNQPYSANLIDNDEIKIISKSRKENMFIKLNSFINDDTYKCTITVRRIENGKQLDTVYKDGKIQISNYNVK